MATFENVFVLCTGRCGSTTFIRACQHLSSHTAAHESRTALLGADRLAYPKHHIEADNRLAWFLGRLDETYGDAPLYVHLRRNPDDVAASFAKRDHGLMKAYSGMGLLMRTTETDKLKLAHDLIHTIDINIKCFLKDKSNTMEFWLETATEQFPRYASLIGAEGDIAAAMREFDVRHNKSSEPRSAARSIAARVRRRLKRLSH